MLYWKRCNWRNKYLRKEIEVNPNNVKIKVKKTNYFNAYCDGLDLRPYKQISNENGPFLIYTEGLGMAYFNDVSVTFE